VKGTLDTINTEIPDRQGREIIIGAVDTNGDGVAGRRHGYSSGYGRNHRVGYAQYSRWKGRAALYEHHPRVKDGDFDGTVRPWLLTKSLCGSSTAVVCPSRPRPKRCQLNGSLHLISIR
jgi:hypothetical protein